MIITKHAYNRISDRVLSSWGSIITLLEKALANKEYSQNAPTWYRGNGQQREGTVWVQFKDIDGQKCAAVVDLEERAIVTVVKK